MYLPDIETVTFLAYVIGNWLLLKMNFSVVDFLPTCVQDFEFIKNE